MQSSITISYFLCLRRFVKMERQETIKGNERKDVDYGREMIDMIFVEHVNRNFIGDYQIHNMEDALKMTGKE